MLNATSHQGVITPLYLFHTHLLFLPPDLHMMNSPAKMGGVDFPNINFNLENYIWEHGLCFVHMHLVFQ